MTMTKAELQAGLDAAGVEYPDDAKKAELQELAREYLEGGDEGPQAEYRIIVANGPFSGQEGKITMARGEAEGWVTVGWLEPVEVE